MRATAALLLSVGLVGVAAGCGSAHRTPASYSAGQVRSVFRKQGIDLDDHCSAGSACLTNADASVRVVVFGPGVRDLIGDHGAPVPAWQRWTGKANVVVIWQGKYGVRVRAALRSLR
jgi:hypothetical protein